MALRGAEKLSISRIEVIRLAHSLDEVFGRDPGFHHGRRTSAPRHGGRCQPGATTGELYAGSVNPSPSPTPLDVFVRTAPRPTGRSGLRSPR